MRAGISSPPPACSGFSRIFLVRWRYSKERGSEARRYTKRKRVYDNLHDAPIVASWRFEFSLESLVVKLEPKSGHGEFRDVWYFLDTQ